jgi:hypothetical protein
MLEMKLSTLAVLLGLGVIAMSGYGVMKPAEYAAWARRFPRHPVIGHVLTLLGTAWFLYYLSLESVSDFTSLKPLLYVLFGGVGIGTCLFVRDFLPVRGLAVLCLLLGKLMVDTARLNDTEWRLVIATWAYGLIVAGIWFTISPWRLRDLIHWATASDQRVKLLCGAKVAFGLLVVGLGLTVFRVADKKSEMPADSQPTAALRLGPDSAQV